jgi:hypothetical protein
MKDEAHLISAGPSVSSHGTREVGSLGENEHEALIGGPRMGDMGGSNQKERQGSGRGGSRKLVKSPKWGGHARQLSGSTQDSSDIGGQSGGGSLDVITEGQRSRWWKRK